MMDYIILGIVVVAIVSIVVVLYKFGKIKQDNIFQWLIWATIEAEKELGSGTGELKLRKVYDAFIDRYKIIGMFLSFETFKIWVDIALVKTRELLENKMIANYVNVK